MTARVSKPYIGIGMDGIIARWYAGITRNNLPYFKKDAQKLAKLLKPGSAVLDLAPGPGYLSIELAKLGSFRITGLDISQTFVEIGTENARAEGVSVEFKQGDAAHMPFEDSTFDLLVCRAAFKNFSQPLAAINEMRRVIKPGGKAVINDLRGDATDANIAAAVEDMHLNPINAFMTRFVFKHSLLKRAYTSDTITALVKQSAFGTCKIEKDDIGMQVWMER